MKIAVSSEDGKEDSPVCPVTGRAPYYIIFEGEKVSKVMKNPFAVGGGGASFGVVQMLSNEGVELIISGKFGQNMLTSLEEKGIKHKSVQGMSAKEAAIGAE
jgi:predicted Fe-Mo cluster-binding NifX family protein